MNLTTIKALALNLEPEFFDGSDELPDLINLAYYEQLNRRFRELFSVFRKKAVLIQEFQQILAENWVLVKNTCLSYSALPDTEVTKLMVNIAIYLSNQMHRQTHPLALLMPDINLESCSDSYPDLHTEVFSTESQILELLKTSIMGTNSLYLLPVKLLTEIQSRPDNPPLYNPYFNFQTMSAEHAEVSKEEKERLFQHSAITRQLHKKISRFEILANDETHLLGQLRQLCRSLRIGSRYDEGDELNAGGSAYDGIIRFLDFYNQLFSKKFFILADLPPSLEEYEDAYLYTAKNRLHYIRDNKLLGITVSNKAKFRTILEAIKHERPHGVPYLLLNVEELHRLIEANSAHQTIDSRISPYLKKEIIKLIHLSSHKEQNLRGTETTETCVATIRTTLILHMTPIEAILSEFRLVSHGESEIGLAALEIAELQQRLVFMLETKNYTRGRDNLENYAQLLGPLDIDYEIHNLDDLNALLRYKESTIKQLLLNDAVRTQAVELFPSTNELITYVLDIPVHVFRIFFEGLGDELHIRLIPNTAILCELLRIFDTERAGIILQAMGEHCIANIPQFLTVNRYLDFSLFQLICTSMKPFFVSKLDLKLFIMICTTLHEETKRQFWVETFAKQVFPEVQAIEDFSLISSFLDDEKIVELFHQCRESLVEQISSTEALSVCLAPLQTAEVCWVYEAIKPKAKELTSNMDDLETFITSLDSDNFNDYCHYLHDHICDVVEEFEQVDKLLRVLDPILQNEFVDIFKAHFLALILTAERDEELTTRHACLNSLVAYKKVFDELKLACNPKYLHRFMLSLEHDDLAKIQRKYMKLFPTTYQVGFFKPVERIDYINSKLMLLRESQKHKLFTALELPFLATSPVLQAEILNKYLMTLVDSGPQAKKAKFSA